MRVAELRKGEGGWQRLRIISAQSDNKGPVLPVHLCCRSASCGCYPFNIIYMCCRHLPHPQGFSASGEKQFKQVDGLPGEEGSHREYGRRPRTEGNAADGRSRYVCCAEPNPKNKARFEAAGKRVSCSNKHRDGLSATIWIRQAAAPRAINLWVHDRPVGLGGIPQLREGSFIPIPESSVKVEGRCRVLHAVIYSILRAVPAVYYCRHSVNKNANATLSSSLLISHQVSKHNSCADSVATRLQRSGPCCVCFPTQWCPDAQ